MMSSREYLPTCSGWSGRDVRLDVLDERVVGLAFDVDAARAVDDFHVSLLDRGTNGRLLRAARGLRLVRLGGLLALQADPVAPSGESRALRSAGTIVTPQRGTDRRAIVVHADSMF